MLAPLLSCWLCKGSGYLPGPMGRPRTCECTTRVEEAA